MAKQAVDRQVHRVVAQDMATVIDRLLYLVVLDLEGYLIDVLFQAYLRHGTLLQLGVGASTGLGEDRVVLPWPTVCTCSIWNIVYGFIVARRLYYVKMPALWLSIALRACAVRKTRGGACGERTLLALPGDSLCGI